MTRRRQLELPSPLALRAASAIGEFLESHAPWTHFVTLTVRRSVEEGEAFQLARRWTEIVARTIVRGHFDVAIGVEAGKLLGRIHAHLVIAIRPGSTLDERAARQAWLSLSPSVGIIEILPYASRGGQHAFNGSGRPRGHAEYVLKADRANVRVACPRDRTTCRHRCREGAWLE